jgi:mannose-1-phosphate guanylyltransferase
MTENITEKYAVILAGGDGNRLKSLTRIITGDERPKQFCPILNNETLLDITRRRVELKIKPENIFYSLTGKHESYYQTLLSGVKKSNLVVQSENKGTAPAILYALMRLATQNADATVAFFPSDHYFSDDEALMNHVERAFETVERQPESLVLLGIEPERAETSYGWIEPIESMFSETSGTVCQVKRFWEKPTFESAQNLWLKGCLWNSFVMVGKVSTFLEVIKRQLPDIYRMFETTSLSFGTFAERQTMRSLYAWINEVNFSSEVLEKCTQDLFVLRVSDVSWSDWGEPNRVFGTLSSLGLQMDWMPVAA